MVIRAPLEQYPPSLNLVALLIERGLNVTVVDLEHPQFPRSGFSSNAQVERISGGRHILSTNESQPGLVVRFVRYLKFGRVARRVIRERSPAVVVAYDPYAMEAAGVAARRKHRLVWHFHEYVDLKASGLGLLQKKAFRFVMQHLKSVDTVVFPDAGRAKIFQEEHGRLETLIVMNCPRRLDALPSGALRALLPANWRNSRIIYFHGWIGPTRCVEQVVHSIPLWPGDTCFVLVGPVSAVYRSLMLKLAAELGVSERVFFLGQQPYPLLNALAIEASLGISLVAAEDKSNINWVYTAGALNKRFEYLAVGLRQISNFGPGVNELFEDVPMGRLVDPGNSEAIGEAVHGMLSETTGLEDQRDVLREAHRTTYCYEVQAKMLGDRLHRWCAEREAG